MAFSRKRPLDLDDSNDQGSVQFPRPSKRTKISHDDGLKGSHVLETVRDTISARPIHALPYRFQKALSIPTPTPSTLATPPPPTPTLARAKAAGIPITLKRKINRQKKAPSMGRQFCIYEDTRSEQIGLHYTHPRVISASNRRGKENIPPADYITPPRAPINRSRTARTLLRNRINV